MKLSIVIGAALKGNFGATMAQGVSQLNRLGQSIKQLESSKKTINKFKQLQRDTFVTKGAWIEAQKQVKSLAVEIAAAAKPSKALIKEFERSKAAALKAKTSYLRKRDSLHNLNSEIQKSGQDIRSLIVQQNKLGSSIEKLKGHYVSLDRIMQKRQGVLAKRSNLRGQLFDAVALGATLSAPIKAAVDFETAMADVRKVVNFDSPDGLQKLGDSLKRMSREIPLSAAGLAQIAASGGQLGIVAKDLSSFTDTVAKMATAFDMSAEEAGDAMAKLSNIYQIPITEMSRLGDAINHLSDNTASKAKDIVPVLNRIGGTAKQFGLTAVQASALASAFISLGKSPEKAGTAINAMLTKLQTSDKQGKKFQDALEQIGFSVLEKDMGAQETLIRFLEAIKKIEKPSAILFDLFGMEYQDDVALLVGSLNEYKKAVKMINDDFAGSMQREFENRSNTTANNLQLFKNGIAEIGINLGSLLLPPLNAIVNFFRKVTTQMASFAEKHPILTKLIIGITASLIGCKVAAIGLGYAWTFIQGGALVLVTALKSILITTALVKAGFATISISSIVGVFILGAALVISNWEKVKNFFMTIWDPIRPIWETFSNWIGKFWKKIPSFSFEDSTKKEAIHEIQPTSKILTNKTENYNINVQAMANQDSRAIADEVMRRLKEKSALYDMP